MLFYRVVLFLLQTGSFQPKSGFKQKTVKNIIGYVPQEDIVYENLSLRKMLYYTAKLKMEIIGLMVNDPNIDAEDLKKIDVPTLVVAGEEDLILKEHTELIASKIPGAKLAFCPGDHFCARENPDAFNAIVGPFLCE